MPIKFRCNHCNQYLGISRSQCGRVVDCPACGRTLRVPELDGTVMPLPQPQLNFEDTRLKEALAELAELERPQAEGEKSAGSAPIPRPPAGVRADSAPIILGPIPNADVISLEPVGSPLTALKVKQRTPRAADASGDRTPAERLAVEGAEAGNNASSAMGPLNSRDHVELDSERLEEFVAVVVEEPAAPTDSRRTGVKSGIGKRRSKARRHSAGNAVADDLDAFVYVDNSPVLVSTPSGNAWSPSGLLAEHRGVLWGVLAVGIGVGWLTSLLLTWASRELPDGSPDGARRVSVDDENQRSVLFGRVTLRTMDGESRPDDGARVIALPKNHADGVKMAVAGFRPADTAAELATATEAIRSLGGDVATADADGKYEITLPAAGEYTLLFLSHYQSRPQESAVPNDVLSVLATYFDQPSQLLGRLQYSIELVRYNGANSQPWDQSFSAR